MKLLHTADWHLGDRLGRIDRGADLRRGVEQIARFCQEHAVDVLAIAGDLFSELARPDVLREAIEHLQATFEPFLRGGGTILAITGNHDNENFCSTLHHAMSLAAPLDPDASRRQPGRLYLAAEPALVRLPDAAVGQDVQFLLLPYPTPARFFEPGDPPRYASFAERNHTLREAWLRRCDLLRASPQFDPALPTVLMAHVQVRGLADHELFRMRPEEDVVVPLGDWARDYAYVALGHIHRPQQLGSAEHVRYSGSLDRLDLGEKWDAKSVVLAEIRDLGPARIAGILPLDATPMADILIEDPAREVPELAARHPEHESMLARLHVQYEPGQVSLEEILRTLDQVFPRWYSRDWTARGGLGPSRAQSAEESAKGFEETVRSYLRAELSDRSAEEQDALLALAESLIREVGG